MMRCSPKNRTRSARAGALLAALWLAGCGQPEQAPEQELPPVATASVVAMDVEERIEATGELAARYRAAVAAEVSGRITKIVVEEGTPVSAGQAVLEIDPHRRELELDARRARVAQADATAAKERRNVGRLRRLSESGALSEARLDDAETALRVAISDQAAERAALGVAEQALADATIVAPFDAVVGRRSVSLGEFVQPGTPLVEFVSLDPIEVRFHVAEIDSGRVVVGQRVEVRVAPFPDEVFEATVDVVYPTIDPATRTLQVKATLDNAERRLRPGLFARADLGIDVRRGVAMVPEEAVLQRADGAVVFVLGEDQRVTRRPVEIGRIRDGLAEIRSGLEAGQVVVRRGQAELIDGALVSPRPESGAASSLAVDGAHASGSHP